MGRRGQHQTYPLAGRALLSTFWGSLCAAAWSAPLLAARGQQLASTLIYDIFSRVCHQDLSRSFLFYGYPVAVCHRCSGIYFGLFIGSMLPLDRLRVLETPRCRRIWVLCTTVPMLLDVGLQFTGLWTNTAMTRLATGFIFGAMLSSLVVSALDEIIETALERRTGLISEA
jgi:uncharacterized membrane protein